MKMSYRHNKLCCFYIDERVNNIVLGVASLVWLNHQRLLWSPAYAKGNKVYRGLNFPPGSVELLWQLPHSVCSHSSLPAPKHRSKSVPPSQVWATRRVVSGIQGDWQEHDWQTELPSWLFVCGLNGRRIKWQLCCAAVLCCTFCFVFLNGFYSHF